MRWTEIDNMTCSIARALSVVGDCWTLLILRELFSRSRRFDEFQAQLGLSPYILSERLNKLIKHGVVRRQKYQDRPARYEYRLTEKGLELYPLLLALLRWGDTWMVAETGPPVRLYHASCGHEMTPELVCSECGSPLHPRDVRPEYDPATAARRAAAVAKART